MIWKKYPCGIDWIDLSYNFIKEINWKGCPQNFSEIHLTNNLITKMNWEDCPQGLNTIGLNGNQIIEMNWEGCSQELTYIDLTNNQIIKTNWEGCSQELIYIYLFGNQIIDMNWRYIPWNLEFVYQDELNDKFNKYKIRRDNIPDLPYISPKHKAFINELTYTFLLPPPHNGFDSSYYKFKLYKNGGVSYQDAMKEMTSDIYHK